MTIEREPNAEPDFLCLDEPSAPIEVNPKTAKLVAEVEKLPYDALLEEAMELYVQADRTLKSQETPDEQFLSAWEFSQYSMSVYLRDATRVPLLREHRSEFILGRIMEIGKIAAKSFENQSPQEDDRPSLHILVAHGKKAKEHFILANTRLVIRNAKGFTSFGIYSMNDIVQEGNQGLLKAVERYNWRKGNKFSTYATWWIRQAIVRAFHYEVHYNPNSHQGLKDLVRFEEELTAEFGYSPTDKELAQALFDQRYPDGLPEIPKQKALARALKKIRKLQGLRAFLSRTDIDEMRDGLDDDLTGEERLMKRIDVSLDPTQDQSGELAAREDLRKNIQAAFREVLTPRERQVLELRHGFTFEFGDGYTYSLQEVGHIMQMTYERIRQIETKAHRKLRHPSRMHKYGFRDLL